MKPLIYAVDDESSIRELYNCAISSSGMNCQTFENADELFEALHKQLPDLIILDVMLDGMNGFEILDKLKNDSKTKDISVIMASAKNDEISKVKGLNIGADDYISKPFGIMEFIARIKANIRKSNNKKVNTYKDISIDDDKHIVIINSEETSLTLKEYDLLKELLDHAESALSRDCLLNRVWGYDYSGETRTLDIHIAELRKILASRKSQAEIVTIRGIGYTLK